MWRDSVPMWHKNPVIEEQISDLNHGIEIWFKLSSRQSEMKMSPANLVFIVALLLIISNCSGAETAQVSDDGTSPNVCSNCSICPYSCHSTPSPPGYPSYGAPPPPDQSTPVQGNCPPTPVVQCCGQHPPPNPYGYVPYDNYSASIRSSFFGRSVNSVVTFIIFFIFVSVPF